jgi:nucleotide-binding universal stress UspA family protein
MRSILVPLDGSSFAESAIPLAAEIARRTGAKMELLTVHEPRPAAHVDQGTLSFDWGFDAELRRELGRYLRRTRATLEQRAPALSIADVLLDGDVVKSIMSYARQSRTDLIVLTTHGLSGPSHTWMGSVCDTLVRASGVPVFAVRPQPEGGGIDTPFHLRRVLVALDGTVESEDALDAALQVADGVPNVTYILFRAYAPLHPLLRAVATEREYNRDLEAQRSESQRYLDDLAARLRQRGHVVECEVREESNPARAIVQGAVAAAADVIVLATHGRGRVGRRLLGSVADKVLRTAPTPVLLHRPASSQARGRADEPAAGERLTASVNASQAAPPAPLQMQ